jgi:hypothetical protein
VVLALKQTLLLLPHIKPLPQLRNTLLKLLRLEQLMGKGDEVKVEERLNGRGFETRGLGEAIPETLEVGGEGVFEVLQRGGADVVADDEEEESLVLRTAVGREEGEGKRSVGSPLETTQAIGKDVQQAQKVERKEQPNVPACRLPFLLRTQEQPQVNLENRLQQPHVGALVKSDLMLPDVDDEDLRNSHREQRRLALEVLVLTAFATVGSFDVHDEDGESGGFRHPDTCSE